jgi:hypothetical protein
LEIVGAVIGALQVVDAEVQSERRCKLVVVESEWWRWRSPNRTARGQNDDNHRPLSGGGLAFAE